MERTTRIPLFVSTRTYAGIGFAGNLITISRRLSQNRTADIVTPPPGIEIFVTSKSERVVWTTWKIWPVLVSSIGIYRKKQRP